MSMAFQSRSLTHIIKVYNFIPDKRLCRVKAWRFGLLFVLLDITAFLVQLAGAGIASGASSGNGNDNTKTMLLGLHIYMGGVSHTNSPTILFHSSHLKSLTVDLV